MWSPLGQSESADGYPYSYSQANELRSQKLTSGVLHKLDSFTQVFANQNLRIQVNNMAQVLHAQSSVMDNASDSALRQLLSQKPAVEQQSVTSTVQRYQQGPQQVHQNFASTQQKQQMQVMQHQQQLYYDYQQHLSQLQMHSAMQQGQPHVQQMPSQQLLPQQIQQLQQTQYYMQQQPQQGQQRLSIQEIQQQQQQQQSRQQQQRQCPVQLAQYYQTQPVMQQLQLQQQQQQQQMQLHLPAYHRDSDPKTVHETHQYSQDQAHPVQLIQLGTMPQYFYQDPQQQYRHLYPQSVLQQQQQQDDSDQQKQYQNDNRSQALMNSHVGLSVAEAIEDTPRQEINSVGNAGPHRTLLAPAGIHLNNKGSQQESPSAIWPQIQLSDGRLQPLSPEPSGPNKGTFPERSHIKSKLTCSICLKEFKSLPALNGHMRSHGGIRASPNFKQDEGEKPPQQQPPKEVDSLAPIVMPVSVPVKLLSPEPSAQPATNSTAVKDKPANSVSDDEMPVLMKMTYSPPCSPKVATPCSSSELSRKQHQSAAKLEEDFKSLQDKKKYRHRPEPLFIPPPSFNFSASYSGATLYQSQLRSPRILGDHLLDRTHEFPPYTPPPMLSPVRQGSGLFSSVITSSHNASHLQLPLTPLTPTPRVLLCRSNSIDGSSIPVTPGPGEQTVDIEPQINIGSRFQADIPELQDRSSMGRDMHKAALVWKPWPELENKVFQQRVEDLLNMCCSSVLPGGGTNSEYALHSLFESKGDIMVALEMLLLRKPVRLKCHPLANYHYAGSDMWTPLERRLFNKALSTYSKDFIFVQKMVKSKTVAQCVEYYYTWKKIMRLGRKHRTRLAEIRDECLTSGDEEDLEDEEEMEEERKSVKEEESDMQKSPEPPPIALGAPVDLPPLQSLTFSAASFICEMPNCGAVFSSRQALNGHARIHGGTNQVTKPRCTVPGTKQKSGTQSGYCSVKSSPAHSTTSGETDPTTIFPCKECGKVFFKIKSRNAHMKTHRQQEEQQRQKAQKAAVAAEMAATIARTTGPVGHGVIPLDHLSLIKHVEHVDDLEDDVVQELGDVMEETEVMDADLLLDDEDADLLQDDAEL
ncbi:transcriptional regulating factor 1 [Chelydra serpentina]|uniref:Transcriptional regulating factor 1 n=1 Tax=Chelydra serpentina TaxID=8475 RepID=A0A8T1SYG4_CHESE|nr:transcriptional regulating factor 1 [Chelydra serpentina]